MKKCLAISIIMILIIGIFGGIVNASSASITPSSKTVELGDTITITVSFGAKVSAARFTLNFDSSKLEYASLSCGGSGSKEFSPYGKKVFAYAGTSDDISSVSFTFKAKTLGTTSVKANNLLISTGEQSRVSVSVGNSASITVKEKSINSNPDNSGTSNNKGNSSNNNNNKKPSNNNNKNTNNNKTEKQEEQTVENEQQPAPNELIKLDNKDVKTIENSETGVMIKALPVAIEDGIVLDVKLVEDNDIVDKILNGIKGNKKTFNIQLLKENVAVQPNGYVTVAIPIPEEFNKERLELYYIDTENEKYELIKGEIQGEHYTFTTDHFSTYVLLEKAEEVTQTIMEQDTVNNQNTVFYKIIAGLIAIIIILVVIIIRKSQNK